MGKCERKCRNCQHAVKLNYWTWQCHKHPSNITRVVGHQRCLDFMQRKKEEKQEKEKSGGMNRLDKTISDVAFILDNLILLRQIQSTGDCNICVNKDCEYKPKAGQPVRYNCPFYNEY